jgi:hypothetical protein
MKQYIAIYINEGCTSVVTIEASNTHNAELLLNREGWNSPSFIEEL